MRLSQIELDEDEKKLTHTFSSWLIDVGDGKIGEPDQLDAENVLWIKILDRYCIPDDNNGISELIRGRLLVCIDLMIQKDQNRHHGILKDGGL
nr:DNA helicase [Tanacetum cinerariifolium]